MQAIAVPFTSLPLAQPRLQQAALLPLPKHAQLPPAGLLLGGF